MATTYSIWTDGGGTHAWATGANWDTGAEPDGSGVESPLDTLIFNDQSAGQLTTFTGLAATEQFNVHVEPGFNYYIGSSGNPMTWDACNLLLFQGNGVASSYLSIDTLTTGVLDSTSTKDDLLVYSGNDSPAISRFHVRNGKMRFASGTDLSSARIIVGHTGGTNAGLTIDSGITTTSSNISVISGQLTTSSSLATLYVYGGQVVCTGSAVPTTLYLFGGEFILDSSSGDMASPVTITTAEIVGGTFRLRKSRKGRAVTTMTVYPGGSLDISTGGHQFAITNFYNYSKNGITLPAGSKITFAQA